MGNEAVAYDVAEADIMRWVKKAGIKQKKQEAYKEQLKDLIEAVCSGSLSVSEEGDLVLRLDTPIKNAASGDIEELTFKSRVSVGAFHNHLKGIKAEDVDGRILAYVSGLTGRLKELIGRMDTQDYDTCKDIAVFFL